MSKFNELFNEFINSMEISECGISYNKRDLEDYGLKLEQERDRLRRFRERVRQFVGRDDDPDDDLIIARLDNLRSWALEMAEELRNQQ